MTGKLGPDTMNAPLSEEMPLTVAVPVPVLLMVRIRLPEAELSASLPKLIELGPTEIWGVPEPPEDPDVPVPTNAKLLGE